MERRTFIASGAAVAATLPAWPSGAASFRAEVQPRAQPFDVARVRLLAGPFLDAMMVTASWIAAQPGRPLEFRTTGQERDLDLVPFYRLMDERYGVYWRIARPGASRG